uniref:Uncharacterized protein n=1 Tax=viral metagenome TaxID=1070528 RepID=A0A6C0HGN5_9ZZZZ
MGNNSSIKTDKIHMNTCHMNSCKCSTCLNYVDTQDQYNTIIENNQIYHQECFFEHIQEYEIYSFTNKKKRGKAPIFFRPRRPKIIKKLGPEYHIPCGHLNL